MRGRINIGNGSWCAPIRIGRAVTRAYTLNTVPIKRINNFHRNNQEDIQNTRESRGLIRLP